MKEQSNIEYLIAVLAGIWKAVSTTPFVVFIATAICTYFIDLWLHLYGGFIMIAFLSLMDTHLAIKACIKSGGKYESKKIKSGVLNKVSLYITLTALGIALDTIFKQIYNYERYYTALVVFAFIALYEAGSIIESLEKIHPKNPIVARFARFLNLADKKLDDKINDKLS